MGNELTEAHLRAIEIQMRAHDASDQAETLRIVGIEEDDFKEWDKSIQFGLEEEGKLDDRKATAAYREYVCLTMGLLTGIELGRMWQAEDDGR